MKCKTIVMSAFVAILLPTMATPGAFGQDEKKKIDTLQVHAFKKGDNPPKIVTITYEFTKNNVAMDPPGIQTKDIIQCVWTPVAPWPKDATDVLVIAPNGAGTARCWQSAAASNSATSSNMQTLDSFFDSIPESELIEPWLANNNTATDVYVGMDLSVYYNTYGAPSEDTIKSWADQYAFSNGTCGSLSGFIAGTQPLDWGQSGGGQYTWTLASGDPGFTGTLDLDGVIGQCPEPSTAILISMCALSLVAYIWRRRR